MENNSKPLVTFIVPVYNVEKYLSRCIDSIINQSYNNIEIILIDDGSPDRCPEICDYYADKYDNVIVIHQENMGLSAARNTGMANSKGDYISFVDSDDFLHPKFTKECLRLIKKYKTQIVQCSFISGSDSHFPDASIDSKELFFHDSYMFGDRRVKITACGKLYDVRSLNSLSFPVGRINEDEFFTYKAIANSGSIAVTNKQLYYYYSNPNSITHKESDYKRLDFIEAYHERISYFKKRNDKIAFNLSLKEYAIRLLLYYCSCKRNPRNQNDTSVFINEFEKAYKRIYFNRSIAIKEKVLLYAFHFSPYLTAKAINKVRRKK